MLGVCTCINYWPYTWHKQRPKYGSKTPVILRQLQPQSDLFLKDSPTHGLLFLFLFINPKCYSTPLRGRESFLFSLKKDPRKRKKTHIRVSDSTTMEMFRVQFLVMAILAIVLALAVLSINAQSLAPAPGPSSDGFCSFSLSLSLSLTHTHIHTYTQEINVVQALRVILLSYEMICKAVSF